MSKKRQAPPDEATALLPAQVEESCEPVFVHLHSQLPLKHPLVLGITSPNSGEGRTTISLGFALAAAKQIGPNGRILLVDGDLEKPGLHELWQLPGEPGLAEVFAQQVQLEQAVLTVLPGISLLPAGKSLPDMTRQFKELEASGFFATLGTFFDAVIIDLPPVQAPRIGTLPEHLVPQVCLVTRAGRTRLDAAQRAWAAFPAERFAAVIVNEDRRRVPRWVDRLLS